MEEPIDEISRELLLGSKQGEITRGIHLVLRQCGKFAELASVISRPGDDKRQAKLALVRGVRQEGSDVFDDELLGVLVALDDVRGAPNSDGQLKARRVLIEPPGENDEIIDRDTRSLLEGHAHDDPPVSEFRRALATEH